MYYAHCQFHDVSESHKAVTEAIEQYLTSSYNMLYICIHLNGGDMEG